MFCGHFGPISRPFTSWICIMQAEDAFSCNGSLWDDNSCSPKKTNTVSREPTFYVFFCPSHAEMSTFHVLSPMTCYVLCYVLAWEWSIIYHLYTPDMPGLRMNASRLRKRRFQSGANLSPGALHWDWWQGKIFQWSNTGYEFDAEGSYV